MRPRALVPAVVPAAALAVLLVAGTPAPSRLIPVGEGQARPSGLSSTAFAAWAGADRRVEAGTRAFDRAVATCHRQTPGGMAGVDDCLGIVRHTLQIESGAALSTSRSLYGAPGPCGRALRIYHQRLGGYLTAVQQWSSAAAAGPYDQRRAAWRVIAAAWADGRGAVRIVRDACTPSL